MPLHMTSMVSRRNLAFPDEKPTVKVISPAFEHVLKFNQHHDSHGRFSSGGGGGKTTLDEAAAKIKAHNDQVDRDRAAGTGEHTTDAQYDAIMAAYRKKKGKTNPQHEGAPGMYERPAPPARSGENVHEYTARVAEEYDKGLDKAYAKIKAHNDQVDRDRAAGTGEHTTDAEYDAIMAAYRKKKKQKA